jgi:hypothetical protein
MVQINGFSIWAEIEPKFGLYLLVKARQQALFLVFIKEAFLFFIILEKPSFIMFFRRIFQYLLAFIIQQLIKVIFRQNFKKLIRVGNIQFFSIFLNQHLKLT